MPFVQSFMELTIEDTVEEGLQSTAHQALRSVMRDYYEHLRETEYHLLPRALDQFLTLEEQSHMSGQIIFAEEDSCLRASAIHLLEQDKYITQLEQKRRQDRVRMMDYEEDMKKDALVQGHLREAIAELQEDLNRREEAHKAEVADLQFKTADLGNGFCYLNSQVLSLQRELDDCKATQNRKGNQERNKGLSMFKLQSENKALKKEIEELKQRAHRNQGHLIESMRMKELLQDKCDRVIAAWKRFDKMRLKEMKVIWAFCPKRDVVMPCPRPRSS